MEKKKELKGFGVLHKYTNKKYAEMPFDEVKKMAIKRHVEKKFGKQNNIKM